MNWLDASVEVLALAAAMVALYFLWVWQRLRQHPHVQPVEIAVPSIAQELNGVVSQVSAIAGVRAPRLFIRRAELPNAFVVASFMRPELYMTDELLEWLDQQHDGTDQLYRIVCHEIAHIKLHHEIPMGIANMMQLVGKKLGIKVATTMGSRWIERMENDADALSSDLYGMACS